MRTCKQQQPVGFWLDNAILAIHGQQSRFIFSLLVWSKMLNKTRSCSFGSVCSLNPAIRWCWHNGLTGGSGPKFMRISILAMFSQPQLQGKAPNRAEVKSRAIHLPLTLVDRDFIPAGKRKDIFSQRCFPFIPMFCLDKTPWLPLAAEKPAGFWRIWVSRPLLPDLNFLQGAVYHAIELSTSTKGWSSSKRVPPVPTNQ